MNLLSLFPLGWQHYLLGGLLIGLGTALLFEPGNAADLADCIERVLIDHELAADMVRRGPELLQLLLRHEQFAWLRSLSAMISTIDAALDEAEGALADADVDAFFGQTRALLRSGGDGPFETKYRQALQRSADEGLGARRP